MHAPCQNSLNTLSRTQSSQAEKQTWQILLAKLPETPFDVSALLNNAPANAQVLYIQLCVALKSEFLISKTHLKACNKQNRDKLFNVIKPQILKNYVLEKVNLQYFLLCGEFTRQL